jgi:hypothetical protein
MLIVGRTKCHAMTVAMETNVSTVQFDDFLASRGIVYFKSCHQTTYQTEEDTDLVWGAASLSVHMTSLLHLESC